MRKLLAVTFLVTLPLSFAAAQSGSQWYIGKPIKDIVFTGLVHVSKNDLQGIVQPFVGKDFTDTLFWDLQSKLYALDYFEQFTPNAEPGDANKTSVIINFQVVERPIVSDIKITGNSHVTNSDILGVVTLKKDDIVNKTKLSSDTQAIENLYQQRGFPNVQVTNSVDENTDAKTAVVTFSVNEGKQTKVKKILFTGNNFASDSTLKGLLTSKEESLFNNGVYQESNIAEDKQAIVKYYQDRGFEDVAVTDVTQTAESDSSGASTLLTLTYHITEGPQYTFGGIQFQGNTLFQTQQLENQMQMKVGEVLNKSKLDAAIGRIHDLYLNDGYIFNTFDTQPTKDTQNNVISYKMTIVERDRAHIEDIIVKGNTKTKDNVILREMPLAVGDVFSKDKVIEGLRNLYNTQYFTSVTPETQPGSVDGLMDLILNVEEAKTTDVNFGISVSGAQTGFPVLGFVKLADQNFLGLGEQLSVSSQFSSTTQNLTFGYSENWLFGKRWSNSIDLTVDHNLQTDQPEDVLPPIFGDQSYAVPDPYTGAYVFSTETDYKGTTYKAGQPFPGIPSSSDISKYSLVTDYAYAQSQGTTIPAAYLMSYDEYDISLAWNTGYSWHTPLGIFNVGTGISTSLSYITYDSSVYRPFNPTVRDNLDTWQPITSLSVQASYDTRDLAYNPSSGVYLKQSATYTGGILPSVRDYILTATRADAYITLWDIPVTEGWSFKTVFDIRTQLSLVFNQFDGSYAATTSDLLAIDGVTIARGWDRRTDGRALWDNWVELRIPIVEQYLWWDFYLSGTVMYPSLQGLQNLNIDDFLFSTGGGIRLTIPGLPIGLYFAKRFKFDNGGIQWQAGNTGIGLDFVLSFETSVY